MIHLASANKNRPNNVACGGELQLGDSVTINRQRCTCSACLTPLAQKKYEDYLQTLAPRAPLNLNSAANK